jgi:Galactose oxidase, central domain
VKQSIGVLAWLACLSIFPGCTSQPPPIPKATVQVGQTGRCGSTHGAFVETGKMLTPRALHTATLLEDGTVLIAGGITGQPSTALDSSEIFDPNTGTFSPSATMTVARQQAVATRLPDGRVLIAGGFPKGIGPFPLYLAGVLRVNSNGALDSGEIYDPKTKSFIAIGSIGQVPYSETLLDSGMVLLISQNAAMLFKPVSATLTLAAKPIARRYGGTALKLQDGRVLLTCEGANEEDRKSAEIYDPKSDRFTRTGDMSQILSFCNDALLSDGRVLVTGENGDTNEVAELYDPQTGTFTSAGEPPFHLINPVPSGLDDGRVLVTSIATPFYPIRRDGVVAQLYNPKSNAFESIGAIPPDRSGYTSTTLLDGSVLIAGGGSDHSPFYPNPSLLYCP